MPTVKRDFNEVYESNIKLVALFDPSVKHHLIETYGLHCFTESSDGLRFELGFTKHGFLIRWLLGFGDKVKVLEPESVVDDVKSIAKNILSRYE
jgi:predicted DNA-binding transcriptional regulator YafY